ncbi:MAG: amidase [Hyphomicrobiaceae bacterium]
MDAVHFKSASELAVMIRDKKIGCVELLDQFLRRVAEHNSKINAVVWLDEERARARARKADEALARGEIWGALHGLPISVKESYQLAGSPTTWGDPTYEKNVTQTTALAVQRLEAAGAVTFAKTNVPIHLADWQSFNEIYGTTKNPWNLDLTPGGSSGGSAAALAAGLTGFDAGSDIGASIRNPAHYCGVFGLKPTYGIIPTRGQALPGVVAPADIAVVGPMGRGAGDLAVGLDIMSGPDLVDDIGWRLELPEAKQNSLDQFRVAVKLSDPNSEVDEEYSGILQDFADCLAKTGAIVSDRARPEIDTARLNEIYISLLRAATSLRVDDDEIARLSDAARNATKYDANSYLATMVRAIRMGHREWLGLNNERHALRLAFNEFFKEWDILLCPAAASPAWRHDQVGDRHDRTIPVNGRQVATTDQLFWAGFSGVVYLPSTVGPAGMTAAGLPVGYQAIAGQYRDKTAIRFSELVEQEIIGFVPPPNFL